MADPSAIAAVTLQLPDEAEELGFNAAAIGTLIDSGLTQTKTILTVLRGMSAKVAGIATSISENSSSRSTDFFNNLKSLIDYWQIVADKEDITVGTHVKEGARIYTAVRV